MSADGRCSPHNNIAYLPYLGLKTTTKLTNLLLQPQSPHGPSRCLALVILPRSDEGEVDRSHHQHGTWSSKLSTCLPHVLRIWTESGNHNSATPHKTSTCVNIPTDDSAKKIWFNLGNLFAITHLVPPPFLEGVGLAEAPAARQPALLWPH